MANACSAMIIAFAALLACTAVAAATTMYPTVAAAVAALPELSTLNGNLQGTSLTQRFADPCFVATVFLPTNDALDLLSSQARPAARVGGDFSSIISDNPNQATEVFGYSVVPGAALLTAGLKDGMSLKTDSGDTLTITNMNGVVSVNGVPVTKSDVVAGKAVVHELGGVLLPPDVADLLSGLTSSASGTAGVDPFASFVATDATNTSDTSSAGAVTTGPSAADAAAAPVAGLAAVAAAPAAPTTTTSTKSGAVGTVLVAAAAAVPVFLALLL